MTCNFVITGIVSAKSDIYNNFEMTYMGIINGVVCEAIVPQQIETKEQYDLICEDFLKRFDFYMPYFNENKD